MLTLIKTAHRQILEMHHRAEAKEYIEVLEGLSRVLERDVLPVSPMMDEDRARVASPRDALFRAGLCVIPFPEIHGGAGLPFSVYAMAMELAGYSDAGTAMSMGIHNTVSEGIRLFGDPAQKKTLLNDLITGKRLAAFSLTEPTSGSDAKTPRTRAVRTGKDYVLRGSKTFITNAGEAGLYLVFADADKGPSLFVVESGTPGISFGSDMPKLGMRSSRTCDVFLQDCRIPESNLIGEEGKGLDYVKQLLNSSRIVMAAICVGVAQNAYDKAVAYSLERKIGGSPISEFQLTKEKIADMVTETNAARLLYVSASRLRDEHVDFSSEAAQAKIFATEASTRICDRAIQIFGGYGYTDADIHRHWRDARLLAIGEGTSEILRLLVARKELAKLR